MPTVLRQEGFRFFFYSNEGNEPPHIHAEHGEGSAKFWLQPVLLASSHGLSRARLARCEEIVRANVELFREKWEEYFG